MSQRMNVTFKIRRLRCRLSLKLVAFHITRNKFTYMCVLAKEPFGKDSFSSIPMKRCLLNDYMEIAVHASFPKVKRLLQKVTQANFA